MMLKHVWIATHHILHREGWEEKYIHGVFPSADVAEVNCLHERKRPHRVSRYDDGEIYIYGPGEPPIWKTIIQPYPVTYRPPMREKSVE